MEAGGKNTRGGQECISSLSRKRVVGETVEGREERKKGEREGGQRRRVSSGEIDMEGEKEITRGREEYRETRDREQVIK